MVFGFDFFFLLLYLFWLWLWLSVCALRQPPHNVPMSRFPHRKSNRRTYTYVPFNYTTQWEYLPSRAYFFFSLFAYKLTHTIAHRELDNQLFFLLLLLLFLLCVVCCECVSSPLLFVTTYGARTRTASHTSIWSVVVLTFFVNELIAHHWIWLDLRRWSIHQSDSHLIRERKFLDKFLFYFSLLMDIYAVPTRAKMFSSDFFGCAN